MVAVDFIAQRVIMRIELDAKGSLGVSEVIRRIWKTSLMLDATDPLGDSGI